MHHLPSKKKMLRWTNYVHKIMATVFQDDKGILQMDFLHTGETTNAAHYNNILHTVREAVWRRYQNSLTLVLPSSTTVQHPTQPTQPNTGSGGKDGKCRMIHHTAQTWHPMIFIILGFSESLWATISWRVIIILLQRWLTNYVHFIQVSLLRALAY